MPVNINVLSASERESRILQITESGLKHQERFRGKLTELSIKRVPLNLPIYRSANARTVVRQGEIVRLRSLKADYFLHGQEDVGVQREQHQILAELAKDRKANIYERLENEREQTQPLIMTIKGVIVNGNRRLAAMRELLAGSPTSFTGFDHVEVALLPADADENDLTALETRLQIAQDVRLDYGWVEECLSLRRQINDLHWDLSTAAENWDEKEPELQARLSMLDTAEQYLEYVGEPNHYILISSDEQAFKTLRRVQSGRTTEDPSRLEAERLILFAVLIEKEIAGRIYNLALRIEAVALKVISNVSGAVPSINGASVPSNDPLAGMPVSPRAVERPVLGYLRDQANAAPVASWAALALDELEEEAKVAKSSKQFFNAASKMNSTAASMTPTGADPATMGPAASQILAAIAQLVERLGEVVRSHPEVRSEIDAGRLDEVKAAISRLVTTLAEE